MSRLRKRRRRLRDVLETEDLPRGLGLSQPRDRHSEATSGIAERLFLGIVERSFREHRVLRVTRLYQRLRSETLRIDRVESRELERNGERCLDDEEREYRC